MFKPLLRTMPSLNGNIKLVCFLNNYTEVEDHIFEANVRTARLNAVSSQLYNKYFNVSLLQSSYEWDVRSFYKKYSDWFYKKLFDVNQNELPMYDEFGTNKNRNTDFEFGLKRVSYLKSNKQFGFFAPIYIENENDIPDYFEINIDIQNNIYKANRKIRVNVGNHLNNNSNYLGRYIYDYAKKIDNNVIYLNKDDNEAIYYGIDVISGGFGVKHDSVISSIFNKQNSILNYDNTINAGFERNKLIIRQIIPLSFYFSLNDILSEVEKATFYGAELSVSGKWIKDGLEIKLHDFYVDYLNFKPTVPKLNTETGALQYEIPTIVDKDGMLSDINIMNIGYPSMKESLFYKYRFTNKFTPNFNRWKLKYSDDVHPYVCNVSCAFSLYQESKIKYGEFPNNYGTVTGVVSKKPYYLNLILPLNGGEERYALSVTNKYKQIQNNFASNWFEIFYSIDDVLKKSTLVDDNKAYFNGILYNLQNIYNSSDKELGKIDRFGVFINPIFNQLTEKQIREDNLYSTNTIFKENSKYITKPNCHVSDNVLSDDAPKIFSNQHTSVKRDEFSQNRIFVYNEDDNGDFIPLNKYGVDWYECNDFIKLSDLSSYLPEQLYYNIKSEATEGYDIVPVYRLSNIINENGILFNDVVDNDNLYISDYGSQAKIKIERGSTDIISEYDINNKFKTYSKLLYRKGLFIDREKAKEVITKQTFEQVKSQYKKNDIDFHTAYTNSLIASYINKVNSSISYQFNPVLSSSAGDNYAFKVFKDSQTIVGNFYGDDLPTNKYYTDKDFIWVDPYNLNHIIHKYNNSWLKDNKGKDKLAYIIDYGGLSHYYHDKNKFIVGGAPKIVYEKLKRGNYNITFDNKYDYEIIKALYNRVSLMAEGTPYKIDSTGEYVYRTNPITGRQEHVYWKENDHAFLKYRIRLIIKLTKNYNNISLIYNPGIVYDTPNDVFKFMHTDKIKIQGVEFYYHVMMGLLGFLTTDAISKIDDSIEHIYTSIYSLLASLGITQSIFNEAPWLFMDSTTSANFNVKFLNIQHLRFYVRELYKGPNESKELTNNGYNALYNNVYVRKRFFDNDMTVKERFIHLYEFISMQYNPSDKGAAISSTMSHIGWDDDKQVFYFNDLTWSGEKYKIGDKEIDTIYIGDPEQFMSTRKLKTGEIQKYFDNTKFVFDLVFNKRMIKVDDNIWKLINLEEKYAAPYKDLYLYEFESDEEFNKNISIRKLYKTTDSKINLTGSSTRGVLHPLFNIATIENKDDAKIYTEYTINNVTKTTWKDWEIIDYNDGYREHEKEDGEIEIYEGEKICSPIKHFYRHNANNEIAMYDLSTINRDVPYSIMDKKYFYKSSWDDNKIYDYCYSLVNTFDYKDKESHERAVENYIDSYCRYFTNTYDLFGLNSVEFTKYSTYEVLPQVVGTYTYQTYSYILYPTNLDENDYVNRYKDDETMMSYYEYGKQFICAGRYPLDNLDISYSYVIKEIIPPYKNRYLIKTYVPIEIENIGEIIKDITVYTYHDSLNIYDDWKLNTYKAETYTYIDDKGSEKIGHYENVYTYGFYLIDVNMNNTTNSFNVESEDGDYIKFISYINGVSLTEHSEIVKDLYKQIVPFVKNNPLRYMMTNAYTVIPPKVFSLPIDYHPLPVKLNNKLTYYDVLFNKGKYGTAAFERYFDNIVPMTKEVTNLITYNMKYKNMKKSFKASYFTNETIYPLDTSISFYPGVRVYNMNMPSKYETKYDYEWKHFNDNRGINLEEHFSYTFDTYLTKNEVAINESRTRVYDIFKEHFINHTSSKLDDRGIEWAFTKYQIEFGCEPVEIDINNEDKLYKLEIKFTLF